MMKKVPPHYLHANILLSFFFLFLALYPGQLVADDLFGGSGVSSVLDRQEFLPVEKAYQLTATRENDTIRLHWVMAEGYYLYKHRFTYLLPATSDDPGKALPAISAVYDRSGKKVYDEFYQQELEVYYNQLTAILSSPEGLSGVSIIQVQSQACADAGLCYPPRNQLVQLTNTSMADIIEGSLPSGTAISHDPTDTPAQQLYIIIGFAVLGGLILNLMPCVFPVLSIKALSLATHHESQRKRLMHGIWYSIGVVASFVFIAILLLLLKSAGEAIGWGFQLQSPIFVTALAYLFILMGLSFSGFFYMGSRLMNVGQSATESSSLGGSFMTGVLAAVVASPCSAPFMGTALGFALTQPAAISLLLFALLGLGMALPFLALSAWPTLGKRIPRPGPWMESLKQFLAFPLYLSAVWLLWVLGRQTSSDVIAAVATGIVLIVFAIWVTHHSSQRKLVAGTLAALAVITAIYLPWNTYQNGFQTEKHWEPYSEQRLNQLINQGEPVFLNVTADWCITCLSNETVALNQQEILTAFAEKGVHYLKADWTRYDPAITKLLNKHQRSGVPLYLYYPPDSSEPSILPQILTKSAIFSEINHK